MFDVFVILGATMFTLTPILLVIALVKTIRRKKSKKWWVLCLIGLVLFVTFELIAAEVNQNPPAQNDHSVSQEVEQKTEPIVKSEETTVSTEVEESSIEVETSSVEKEIDLSVSFDEVYRAYKENELRADDTYKGNVYRITAKVNGMKTGGLLNLTGGATLTMEKQIDSTIVFFYAEFEKEQEENLKTINVGDTITFEGKCLSAGTWTDCELIIE